MTASHHPPTTAKTKILYALAEAHDTTPRELGYTLQEYIDTDAIEMLADDEASTWTLTFDVPDARVCVTSDDELRVDVTTQSNSGTRSTQTGTATLGHCPKCGRAFERTGDGQRRGYRLLAKGTELALLRCTGCRAELPAPETDDIAVSHVLE